RNAPISLIVSAVVLNPAPMASTVSRWSAFWKLPTFQCTKAGEWFRSSIQPCELAMDALVQLSPHACIADDVRLGARVHVSPFVNLYGCEVGDDSRIGAFVEVQRGARIG